MYLRRLEAYLDEVLAANQQVEPYRSLSDPKGPASVDEALCRFLVHLLGFPVVDIGIAARRCLAKYVGQDGRALASVLLAEPCWDAVQLEHILVALHVGSLQNPRALDPLREFITGLNRHESVAVRGIARRMCQEQGWAWTEINDMPSPKLLLIPTPITAQATYNEARMLVGGDVAVAAELVSCHLPCPRRDAVMIPMNSRANSPGSIRRSSRPMLGRTTLG